MNNIYIMAKKSNKSSPSKSEEQPVETVEEQTNEDEKVKNYLDSLKAKLAAPAAAAQSDDDKVKSYLDGLKAKLAAGNQQEQAKPNENVTNVGKDYFDHSDAQIDYFHCSHYIDVNIGRWDQPYALVK